MKNIKKAIRLLFLILFLFLAAFGLGVTGVMQSSRERFLDVEIRTEQVDKKAEEDSDEEDDVKT
jgi:hypothetical protein